MGIKSLKDVVLDSRHTFLRRYIKEMKYGKSLSDEDVHNRVTYIRELNFYYHSLHTNVVFTTGTNLHLTLILWSPKFLFKAFSILES